MSEQEKWEGVLHQEGLSMKRGAPEWLSYVEDTDVFQRERPRSVGKDGGLLSREYQLGNRTEASFALVCEACGKSFSSPRSHSAYCSSPCRQKAYRKRQTLQIPARNSGETN